MVRQGSKVIEEVTRIECRQVEGMTGQRCKIESQQNLPGNYNNIEDIDIKDTKLREHRSNGDKTVYEFSEPETCEIVFGSQANRIECTPETGL